MATRIKWNQLFIFLIAGVVCGGWILWHLSLQGIDQHVRDRQAALKKLVLTGQVPPNQDVIDYLTARQHALDKRYQDEVAHLQAHLLPEATGTDPQLSFQEHAHDVQRTLQRLATASQLPVPEALGLPKELPPPETVPRLLVQLNLLEEVAELMFQQHLQEIASFKLEDIEFVPGPEGDQPFLVRLPIRVRLTGALAQIMKTLAALERTKPFIDLRGVRLNTKAPPDVMEGELLLARYTILATASSDETAPGLPTKSPQRATHGPQRSKTSPGRSHHEP